MCSSISLFFPSFIHPFLHLYSSLSSSPFYFFIYIFFFLTPFFFWCIASPQRLKKKQEKTAKYTKHKPSAKWPPPGHKQSSWGAQSAGNKVRPAGLCGRQHVRSLYHLHTNDWPRTLWEHCGNQFLWESILVGNCQYVSADC